METEGNPYRPLNLSTSEFAFENVSKDKISELNALGFFASQQIEKLEQIRENKSPDELHRILATELLYLPDYFHPADLYNAENDAMHNMLQTGTFSDKKLLILLQIMGLRSALRVRSKKSLKRLNLNQRFKKSSKQSDQADKIHKGRN